VEKGSMSYVQQKTFLLFISFFLILFSFFTCEKSTAPENKPQVTLSAEYVGVTEAEILLQTRNIEANTRYQLFRDDSLLNSGNLLQADTTITDTLLLPAHSYTYKAQLLKDRKPVAYSQLLHITTMDTTSHNFQWELIEFPSPYGSAVLQDVAIISEDDIWAVGQIYSDSAQPGLPYNAVHWDGQQWELKRIKTNACGGVDYPPINAIFAFSFNDVLFAHTDGSITHYNGSNFINDCSLITQLNGSAKKMWGTSRNDLYVVSGNGFIAHYNGSSWQKIESGTELPINDIWGVKDQETGENYILCPASDKYHTSDKKLLSIKSDKTVTEISWPFSNRDPYSVWFKSKNGVYICGGGVIKRNLKGEYHIFNELPRIFMNRIRANHINDIFVVGDFGIFAHYNGKSWWIHPDSFYGTFLSVDVKENTIVAVGEQNAGDKALIMVLTRY
jgi:hypothetical protein